MALILVIFCGPVKKLIELRQESYGLTTSQSLDNKLRTGYRQKKDIVQLVPSASHPSPDTGLTLFTIASFVLLLSLSARHIYSKVHFRVASILQTLSLYLRLRRLQV